ncbi:MAG: hypothetical protein WCQ99_12090 [Pseudomonadota bacterium]
MTYYHYYTYPVLHELTNTYDKFLGPRKYVSSLQEGIVHVTEKSLQLLAESGTAGMWKLTDAIRNADDIVSLDLSSLRDGMASLGADYNIALGGVLVNFDMARKEFREAVTKLTVLFQKEHKVEAENRFRDALRAYRDGCRIVDKPDLMNDALKNLQGVIDKYRENPLAYLHMGHLYHYQDQHRNLRRAMEYYTQCATLAAAEPEQAVIAAQGFFYAGWLSAAAFGSMQSGIELTQKALELDPSLGEAHYHLAKLYGAFGDVKEAVSHLRKALELFDRKYCLKIEADDDFKMIREDTKRLLYEIAEKDLAAQEEWLNANGDSLTEVMKMHAQDKLHAAQRKLDTNDYPQIVQAIMLLAALKDKLGQEAGAPDVAEKEKEQRRAQEEEQRKAEAQAMLKAAEEERMKKELKALIEAEMKQRIEVEKIKAKKRKVIKGIVGDAVVILLALMLGSLLLYGISIAGFVLLLITGALILAWVLI